MLCCESNLNEKVKSKEETAAENGTTERRKGKIRTCGQLQGLHSATLMEPEASPDRHDCQLTYCEAWNHWGCRDSLGHNATDELHVGKIHRRGPQDKYEYQPEHDGHTGLETHVHTASSTAGVHYAQWGLWGLSMNSAQTPPHRASYK